MENQAKQEEVMPNTEQEHNEEAVSLLNNLFAWASPQELRQFLMQLYVHTVGTNQYREMSHHDQLSMAMTVHKLTDFFERIENWTIAGQMLEEQDQ